MNKDKIPDKEYCEYSWAKKFIEDNEVIFRNNLLQSFLDTEEHWRLLDQSIQNPTFETKMALDKAFQEHLSEIRLISQLSNNLRRYAIRYDQKMKRNQKRQLLILDQPATEDDGNTILDLMPDDSSISITEQVVENEKQLEGKIEDPELYRAIISLTPRQKSVLEASYLFHLTDTEIAAREGVSQQSITKTRNKALGNLKKQLEKEEIDHDDNS